MTGTRSEKSRDHRQRTPFGLYPRSLLQFMLLGIAVTVLPLLIALGIAAVYVERATTHSQQAVLHATQAARQAQLLTEHLRSMERTARVYQVLGESELLDNYTEHSEHFRQSADTLLGFDNSEDITNAVNILLDEERELNSTLHSAAPGSQEAASALETFEFMRNISRMIISRNTHTLEDRVEAMNQASSDARRVILIGALLILAASITLSLLVIPPLIRSMQRLDSGIQQLGSGNFTRKIEVPGPRDVQTLGTRLEWLRQQLEALENQKRVFLRHFSHELKTPLASIREGAGLLTEQVVGELNTEQTEIARILQENSLQLQKRIEDLLTFSISQQPDIIEPRPVRLDLLLEEVVRDHRLPAKSKKVEFLTELTPVALDGDPARLANVLDNLISNAVKYSPQDGRISLSLTQQDDRITVDICDDGPGIRPDEQERVFQAFYQGDNQYDGHVKGTGLGLSIARHYARAHGGDIEVLENQRGAHFQLTLPRQQSRA